MCPSDLPLRNRTGTLSSAAELESPFDCPSEVPTAPIFSFRKAGHTSVSSMIDNGPYGKGHGTVAMAAPA